jgi:hypothetical protein
MNRILAHSAAPSPAFKGGVKKRRSESTLSKPQHLCWGVEGLTKLDRGYVSDQTPFKYYFTNLGISIGCESCKRASYLHTRI